MTEAIKKLTSSRQIDQLQLFLLGVLLYGTMIYVYSYNLYGLSLRIEHLAFGALILTSPFFLFHNTRQELLEIRVFVLFGIYLLISIVSIMLNSTSYLFSFAEIGLQLITVSTAIFTFFIIDSESKIRLLAVIIILLGMIESVLGIGGVLYSTLISGEIGRASCRERV